MRPARRWAGVWPGLWLAALLSLSAQSIAPAATRGVTVSGSVVTANARPLQSGAVLMTPLAGDTLASHPTDDVRFLPDGSFSFGNVAPGDYQIRARAQTADGSPLFAGYRVQVRDRDIAGLRLVLRPGATVMGTVEVDPGDAARVPPFAGLRVRAPFVDGSSFADALTGDVERGGGFRLTGVMEGQHYLTVEGLPAPWVVKQAHLGGRDLADVPFTATSGETIRDVRITISTRGAEIRGTVRNQAGQPAGDVAVIISPASYGTWLGGSRRFVMVRTDSAGRYRHRGLPAGAYRVVASGDLLESDVRASRARNLPGVVVHLDEGGARELDLVLTAGAPAMRPAAR